MKAMHLISRLPATVLLVCNFHTVGLPGARADALSASSPDQLHAAVAADEGRVHYRRVGDHAVERTFFLCNPQALGFSADGQFLAAAGGRKGTQAKIKVWRVADGRQVGEILVPGEGIKKLAVSGDGRMVIGSSGDGRVDAWLVADGKARWSRTFSPAVPALSLEVDSGTLLVRFTGGTEHRLDPANGRNAPRREPAPKSPGEADAARQRAK